jgi:hypothetical protein
MAAPPQDGERGRWLLAGATAAVACAGAALLFGSPAAPPPWPPPAVAGKFSLRLAPPGATDARLRQETELRDLRPLFLPTSRNAALREPRREPGRTLLDDEDLKLKFADADLSVEPPVVLLNGIPVGQAAPVEALAIDADLAGLAGFGRRPTEAKALEPRGGFLEIAATRDGAAVLAVALPVAKRPVTDKTWGPLEFFAAVDAIGLASPLVLTVGSQVEEVDAHFRKFLTEDFRVGARLPPGFYRITVAP